MLLCNFVYFKSVRKLNHKRYAINREITKMDTGNVYFLRYKTRSHGHKHTMYIRLIMKTVSMICVKSPICTLILLFFFTSKGSLQTMQKRKKRGKGER